MSSKSTKKVKTLSVPRELSEIQKAYQQQCINAGQIQYQIEIFKKDLDKVNEALLSLNREASARNQLDAESKAKEASNEG